MTKKEINVVFHATDINGDGLVDFHEFFPIFHQVVETLYTRYYNDNNR